MAKRDRRSPKDGSSPAAETPLLAANLRRQRLEARLTLDQLAERSEVSRAMISKIERGVSAPTTTVLGKLAAALKLSLSQLLGTPHPREPRLVKRSEQQVFRDPETGFERRSLSPLFDDGAVDVAFNVLPAGRSASFPAHHEGVEEYLFVQEGSLTVIVGSASFSLATGEMLFYPSSSAHEFRNTTDRPAIFLIVIDDRTKR